MTNAWRVSSFDQSDTLIEWGEQVDDGRILLVSSSLICLAAFFIGRRFSRMDDKAAQRVTVEMSFGSTGDHARDVRRVGWLMMVASPVLFLFFVALCFGVLGPVDGINTINLSERM